MRRSNPLRIVVLVALSAGVAIWVGLRLRDGEAGARTSGTGVLAGVVIDSQGRALAAVNVRISSPRRQTTTDANGRFSFEKLPASTYEVTVEKEGYLTPDLGAGWLASPGTTLQLDDGQRIADLALTMVQGGAIAGVVYDQKGQPASGRFVRALRASPHGPDVLDWGARSIWSTDELGRYLITGLPAGEYVVMAALDRTATERVYYPNASRFAQATPVVVELGLERTGIDLRAAKVRTSRIQGRITREDGTPMSVPVDLVRSGETEPDDRRVTVTANTDGRFTFESVPADDYWIIARAATPEPLWATADVTTTGRNTATVLLTAQEGRTISGRVVHQPIAGTVRTDPNPISIYLIPADARTRAVAQAGERLRIQPAANGEFTMAGVPPGKYVLRDTYVGPWLLESAVIGRDRLDVPFDVQADRDVAGAVLTLTDQLSEVNGMVQVQARPVPSQLVMAFSADDRFWGWLSPRVRLARSDASGRFVIAHLPAGDYFVAAPDTFAPGMWFDFKFLTKVSLQAARITLAPGERQTLTISLQTPPR
jgi:hypothetical protein